MYGKINEQNADNSKYLINALFRAFKIVQTEDTRSNKTDKCTFSLLFRIFR